MTAVLYIVAAVLTVLAVCSALLPIGKNGNSAELGMTVALLALASAAFLALAHWW